MVTPDQISTFFNIYRHKSVVLTQFHLISSSTKLHWPSTTKYQPVPPHTDPVPPSTNQYHLLLTKYQDFSVFLLLCEKHIFLFRILSSFSSSVYRPFSEKYFPSPYIFLLLLLCRPEMSTVLRYLILYRFWKCFITFLIFLSCTRSLLKSSIIIKSINDAKK